jgi:hypothetical protein
MALTFIGIDPGSNSGACPSVWIDQETGDLVFQGQEVTDQATLAEVANRSPIAADEKIVRLPLRMRSIIREACGDGAANLR